MKVRVPGPSRVCSPVYPDFGLAPRYAAQLHQIIDTMHHDLLHSILAAYNPTDAYMAMDGKTADLRNLMGKLARHWQKRFNEAAKEIAGFFAKANRNRTDYAMMNMLRNEGVQVRLRNTAPMSEVQQAIVAENVRLIKSIAFEHLDEVQGVVLRAIQSSESATQLSQSIYDRWEVTRRRAEFIAHDQICKMHTATVRCRQIELGIFSAQWHYTGRSRNPRHSHVEAGAEGLVYDARVGAYIDGQYIYPGQMPGCKCVPRPVIPGVQ